MQQVLMAGKDGFVYIMIDFEVKKKKTNKNACTSTNTLHNRYFSG